MSRVVHYHNVYKNIVTGGQWIGPYAKDRIECERRVVDRKNYVLVARLKVQYK